MGRKLVALNGENVSFRLSLVRWSAFKSRGKRVLCVITSLSVVELFDPVVVLTLLAEMKIVAPYFLLFFFSSVFFFLFL